MSDIKKIIAKHKRWDFIFSIVGLVSMFGALLVLAVLVGDLFLDGLPRFSKDFFISYPSRFPEKAGILSAWVGTIAIMTVTACAAIPLGIAAGIYLEEYAPKNWFTDIIEINVSNLAGVPSIVYGLMALGLFVYELDLGRNILTGGLTLALLILPMIIIATREAIRAIPQAMREASYAMGATKWQTTRHHVLPYASPSILTGIIIALSRAIGETAPLITIGALTFIAFLPQSPISTDFPFISFEWIKEGFTVMPVQMFNWISRPQEAFHFNAAAAGIVLMSLTLLMNAVAIVIRYRVRKRIKW